VQQLGDLKTAAMLERYSHLASDHLASAAVRPDSMFESYDLVTAAKK
jgi:hypothetical protein